MSYNGYPSQDAFHEALRARWAAMTPDEVRATMSGHGGCDHAYGICNGGDDGRRVPTG